VYAFRPWSSYGWPDPGPIARLPLMGEGAAAYRVRACARGTGLSAARRGPKIRVPAVGTCQAAWGAVSHPGGRGRHGPHGPHGASRAESLTIPSQDD
jgi:hypothetical protein